ncbi:MAG: STAS domain-containing protein [Terriglobales bacterium]
MPITHAECETQYILRLEGDVDVGWAAELKRMLIEAVSSRKELQVDLTSVTDLDITVVQLLWAARREAEKAGTRCVLGPVPDEIVGALEEAGFEDFLMPAIPEGAVGERAGAAGSERR